MKKALYLDDVRTPSTDLPGYEPWVVVRNFNDFKNFIVDNGIPDLISFDHDLAEEHMNDYYNQFALNGYQNPDYSSYKEMTGLDCAYWLVKHIQDNNLTLNKCCVHSHNPVGAANIQSYLNGFKKHMDLDQDVFIMKVPFTVNS
jgi:hypothetical protein